MSPTANRRRISLGMGLLVALAGMGGCKSKDQYVQFANGFEFDVTAKLDCESGGEQTITVPAKSRVGAELSGKCEIEFESPEGSMSKKNYTFEEPGERKDGCFEYVNILGSAAIVEEDMAYGIGIKSGDNLIMGREHVKVCPRWGFDETPPESIAVEEGTMGMNKTWIHYDGDGDWHATIERLLSLEPPADDSYRIRAWNLAVAVSKHDPKNERLQALGPKFKAACAIIPDFFAGGPMAGKAEKDCLANAKALFPDA